MSDKVWKTQEIRELCPNCIAIEAKAYIKAIKNKIDRILFAVHLLSTTDGSLPTNFEYTALRSSQLKVEIYIESIVTNLHSLADVLAHVINVIVLKPLQAESQYLVGRHITISAVKTKLNNLSSLDPVKRLCIAGITKEIDTLIQSVEFKYIAAFTNTIKHRSLLDTELFIRYESGNLMDSGFRIDQFNYESVHFPQTKCSIVAMDYRKKVIDLVFDVGNRINNYCRAEYIDNIQE